MGKGPTMSVRMSAVIHADSAFGFVCAIFANRMFVVWQKSRRRIAVYAIALALIESTPKEARNIASNTKPAKPRKVSRYIVILLRIVSKRDTLVVILR